MRWFAITIEQLTYFLRLSEFKNFSLASHELCISQSSLSKHIKALENELNATLFDRNTRTINLTHAGHEFYIYAKKAIEDYNNIVCSLKKYTNSDYNESLNIGCIPVISQYKITGAIAHFSKLYPSININILEDEGHNILRKLIKSELNFGIVRDFNLSEDMFNKTTLSDDELVFISSKSHFLSQNKGVSLLDIKDEKFILLGPKSGIYEKCINEFDKHSLSLNIVGTYNKIETIIGLVSENLGSTLLMKKVLNAFDISNVCVQPIKKPIKINLSLINEKNKDLSDSEILFMNFLENYLKDENHLT